MPKNDVKNNINKERVKIIDEVISPIVAGNIVFIKPNNVNTINKAKIKTAPDNITLKPAKKFCNTLTFGNSVFSESVSV